MSDEEKEAIEILKLYFGDNPTLNITKYVNIVLNLIEKQQKEIEELKENNGYHLGFIDGGIAKKYEYQDKIKAKIEEYENKIKKIRSKKVINEPEDTIVITRYAHYISVLQSLLEKE